eukprot:GHVU01099908.1.p1 GENE.GHVU01099908.1~~GHVU01099908.1.p1  ORF type:complete len:101 (-),score=5.76 GHVU01099908.1:37-339(-)
MVKSDGGGPPSNVYHHVDGFQSPSDDAFHRPLVVHEQTGHRQSTTATTKTGVLMEENPSSPTLNYSPTQSLTPCFLLFSLPLLFYFFCFSLREERGRMAT